ncbi:MAG: fused MFS/spermidine synthase [Planctomycetes bacterium]|nr:fused MFS/spermidine synthase [Planctomycetota bacterium]
MLDARRQNLFLSGAFFVASGATALAYEVIWFKRFGHVWGSSAHAWAAVVAAYLLGLGLGARFLGAWAARVRRPLFAYGVAELVVTVAALAIPFEIGWLASRAAAWTSLLGDAAWAQAAIRFALTFAVLAPPTIAMGATLPLLVRHFVVAGQSTGAATSVLYALNALGAAGGAWLAGFDLLPALGLLRANYLVAAVSFAVGVAACALGRAEIKEREPETDRATPHRGAALAFAAAATGAGALILQMLWSRDLAVLIGSTTYAYTAVLAVFVAGLGLGSLVLRLIGRSWDPLQACGALIAILVATTLLGRALQPWLSLAAGGLLGVRVDAAGDTAVCVGFACALVLLPTFAMGAIFPSLVRLAGRDDQDSGAVGFVYGWNTLGSIPAAALTNVAILPSLGSSHGYRVALGAYLASLLALLVARPRQAGRVAPATVLLGVAALSLWPTPAEPLATHRGRYMYGNAVGDEGATSLRAVYFANGASADVLVVGENEDALPSEARYAQRNRSLFVDGKVDASTATDMRTQVSLAYLPRCVRPDARSVLVIGMGTGTTAGASLLYPETKVTCVEIEPAVIAAIEHFAEVNHRPWESPNFRVVPEDGRAFLQATDERFDLIVSEPSNPWMVGVSNLFTEEFYRAANARLERGGVLAQWLQTYALSLSDYAMIVRTLRSVFPHVVLARIDESDTILFASRERIVPDSVGVDAIQRWIDTTPDVSEDLERWCGTTDARTYLLSSLMLDQRGLERLLAAEGGTSVHTDLALQIEYSAPRSLFAVRDAVPPGQAVLRAYDLAFARDTFLAWGSGVEQVDALTSLKDLMLQCGRRDAAAQLVELALTFAPDRPALLVDQLVLATDAGPDETRERIEHLIAIAPDFAFEAGTILAQNGAPARALPVFEALRARHPDSPRVLTALSTCYATVGREEEARLALEHARTIDPFDELGRNLERVLDSER